MIAFVLESTHLDITWFQKIAITAREEEGNLAFCTLKIIGLRPLGGLCVPLPWIS